LGCNVFVQRIPGYTLDIVLMLGNLSYKLACKIQYLFHESEL